MPDLDPNLPVVGEDGLEYETLGHLICNQPVSCARNDVVRTLRQHSLVDSGLWTWKEAVFAQYQCQSRNGYNYSSSTDAARTFPQGLEFFDPSRSEGDGSPRPVEAPADPVHAAD